MARGAEVLPDQRAEFGVEEVPAAGGELDEGAAREELDVLEGPRVELMRP